MKAKSREGFWLFCFILEVILNLMRKTFLLLILLLLSSMVFGQHKKLKPPPPPPGPPTKAELAREALHDQCLHTNRYSAKERQAFFPFTAAASIRLISYDGGPQPDHDIIIGDQLPIPAEDTLQLFSPMGVNKFYINYCQVIELKDLSPRAIDSLTDILYNVGYTPVKDLPFQISVGYNCYEPRNAILFLDARGNVTQYIEFCFGCKRYYYSSSKTKPIDYCEQKYSMLRSFFFRQGLNYGTIVPNQDDWLPPTMLNKD